MKLQKNPYKQTSFTSSPDSMPIVKINRKNIKLAKKLIQNGDIIAIPTETVYGLSVNALDKKAVRKLYKIKKRPTDKAINILLPSKKDIEKYAVIQNEIEKKIIKHFMPGEITLILQKKELIPDELTAGKNEIGIRIPKLKKTRKILKGIGLPLATPSANISGAQPATNASEVEKIFGNKVKLIFDGGESKEKLASTVCKVENGQLIIFRIGPIKPEILEKKLGIAVKIISNQNSK